MRRRYDSSKIAVGVQQALLLALLFIWETHLSRTGEGADQVARLKSAALIVIVLNSSTVQVRARGKPAKASVYVSGPPI